MMDSSPIVCITGQVASKFIGYDAFQEIDITGITLPITKHNYLVTDVNDLTEAIREAFYVARTGRPGPVLVDVAKDVQQASIEWEYDERPIRLPGYRPDKRPLPKDMQQAAEMIQAAKRPVILAGRGVLLSGATHELSEFAEKTETPVAMTLLGIGGFPASHTLNLGMMGMHGEAWVNTAIQQADLLLAFGMRFDDRVTGNLKTYAPGAKKIHIEIDASEVNKNVPVDLALIGDLRETLRQLLPHLEACDHSDWIESINEMKGDSASLDIQNLPDNGEKTHIEHHVCLVKDQDLHFAHIGMPLLNQVKQAPGTGHDYLRSFFKSGHLRPLTNTAINSRAFETTLMGEQLERCLYLFSELTCWSHDEGTGGMALPLAQSVQDR